MLHLVLVEFDVIQHALELLARVEAGQHSVDLVGAYLLAVSAPSVLVFSSPVRFRNALFIKWIIGNRIKFTQGKIL